MEVICDRCNAEYEFEEALVSTGGTTVKCTNCGHLFKVYRTPRTEPPPPSATHAWLIQYEDGRREEVPSLRHIAKRMRAGHLTPNDQISRTGRAFRKLGEIEELRGFFRSPKRPGRRARYGSPRRPGDAGANVETQEARPSGEFGDDDITQPAEYSRTAGVPASGRPWPARLNLARVKPPPPTAYPLLAPARPVAAEPPLDTPAPPANRLKPAALSLAVLLGAAMLWWWWPTAPTSPSPSTEGRDEGVGAEQTVRAAVELGDDILASYDLARFPRAVKAYSSALTLHENDPHLLSSLSRLHAHWSQQLLFELGDLAEGRHPEPVPEYDALTGRQAEQAALAKSYAARAARKNPGNEEAETALADALRLNGNLVAARAELDRAKTGQPQLDSETLRVAALLAIAEANGQPKAGRALSEQATHQADCALACRILYLRILAADNQALANTALRDLEHRFPSSPEVRYLRALYSRAPNKPSAATRDPITPEVASARSDAKRPGKEPDRAAPNPRVSITSLCRRGERALEEGDVATAEALFEQAYALRPKSPRVATGRGYVALERGQVHRASDLFQTATAQKYGEAYIGLGLVLRQQGKPAEAAATYRAYLEQYPQGRSAGIAQRQLAALQPGQ